MHNAAVLYPGAYLSVGYSGAAPLGENIQPHGLRVYQSTDKRRRIRKAEVHAVNGRKTLAHKFPDVKILLLHAVKNQPFGYAPLTFPLNGIAARIVLCHVGKDGFILIGEPLVAFVGCSSREDVRVWRIKETRLKP